MFLRNLVGMLTRKVSPWAVTASWRLLPRLPVTYKCKGTGWRYVQDNDSLSYLLAIQRPWTAHLYNLLVLRGRDKISKDLLDNMFAFSGLWHYQRWASGSFASCNTRVGDEELMNSSTVVEPYIGNSAVVNWRNTEQTIVQNKRFAKPQDAELPR